MATMAWDLGFRFQGVVVGISSLGCWVGMQRRKCEVESQDSCCFSMSAFVAGSF